MKFRTIHHVDGQTIAKMFDHYEPVFILSTGRSGSKFIANLLGESTNMKAFHEPRPTLQYFPNYAYHHQHEEQVLTQMLLAARLEMMLEVYIGDRIFAESNQCLTFFAPVLANIFKKGKFIHLVRHPGDFTRSALRKGWHKNDSIWEEGRVRPADPEFWDPMDNLEKLAWLWATTNHFIEEFKKSLPPKQVHTVTLESLVENTNTVDTFMQFCGAQPLPGYRIRELQGSKSNELYIHPDEPANIQKVPDFPVYSLWDDEKKRKLLAHTGHLATIYGYKLT